LEENHPEPFLMKRPNPPEEGNKVRLGFEGSDLLRMYCSSSSSSSSFGLNQKKQKFKTGSFY